MEGILIVDKPKGITSYRVVDKIKSKFNPGKVGHTGTLDPQATGVLVLCIGKACKVVRFLMAREKEYAGKMILGITTDTHDLSGKVVREEKDIKITPEEVKVALAQFRGEISQVPPMVSALHYRGKRLYQLAREGKEVPRKPRKVFIREVEILECRIPEVSFRVVCSSGTYIRSLVRDVGERLGCGATLAELRRLRSGNFRIEDALPLEEILKRENLEEMLIPLPQALKDFPGVRVRKEVEQKVLQGGAVGKADLVEELPRVDVGSVVRVMGESGNLLSMAQKVKWGGKEFFKALRVLGSN